LPNNVISLTVKFKITIEKYISSGTSNMSLTELLPTVNQLSHQDKLRLIYFLLLAVAKEEGCSLEPTEESHSQDALLQQLVSTGAVVWSPQMDSAAVQALSDLLVAAKEAPNA
jgi:hypothetical protein